MQSVKAIEIKHKRIKEVLRSGKARFFKRNWKMSKLTTLEIILITSLIVLLIQYLVSIYVTVKNSHSIDTALDTMKEMQAGNKELFQKLLKEEMLTMSLAKQVKEYREMDNKSNTATIKGMH